MGLKSCQADVVIGAGPDEIGQGRCEMGEEVTHSPGAFAAVAAEWEPGRCLPINQIHSSPASCSFLKTHPLTVNKGGGSPLPLLCLNIHVGMKPNVHPAVSDFWFALNRLCAIFEGPTETLLHTYQHM